MRIRCTFRQRLVQWLTTLIIFLSSSGISQTWRDTLQYAMVKGVGASIDGTVVGSPENAIVEQKILFHLKEEEKRRETSGSRVLGTTFSVTTTEDTGDGSLRKAIDSANISPGLDLISFRILPGGPQWIVPRTKLPNIVDPVIIDGTTQLGFVDQPLIEISFHLIGSYDGLDMYAGNSTVRGLVLNRVYGGSAIVLWAGGGNVVEGNFIGTNLYGTAIIGNTYNGVYVRSPKNRIGGTTPAQRNVFAGNGYPDVAFGAGASEDLVQGNYFGTDLTGMSLLGSPQGGIVVDHGSVRDTIGGIDPGARNIISGGVAPYSGITVADVVSEGTGKCVILGNFIGTDVTGTLDFGNGGNGIHLYNSADNIIGGVDPRARNIISGNTLPGVSIHLGLSENNTVQGNYIGTDYTGKVALGNSQVGILIDKAPNNLIGGLAPGAGNLISGNALGGVAIRDTTAFGNQVQGNLIGTMPDGVTPLANGLRGVWLIRGKQNIIGGPIPQAGNVISGNNGNGVTIEGVGGWGNTIQNNYIGTDISGKRKIGNSGSGVSISEGINNLIRYNIIYSNGGLGIDLKSDGVTPNDTLDTDEGANTLLNFPILDSATIGTGTIRILGNIRGKPNFVYDLDFFRNDIRNESHFGEGQTFIGSATLLSDGAGKVNIDVTFSAVVTPDQFITATATDPDRNTSEFSRALCLSDLDGDGILDCWESKGDGIDVNADNVIDLDLYAKGARPDHKDIFVEVDYMFGAYVLERTLPLVQSAFASIRNKYVNNPDGQDGINLFAELDPYELPIKSAAWADPPWPEFFAAKNQFFGTSFERADPNAANILEAKRLVYRYCIFANTHGTIGYAGDAEWNYGAGGNDFLVTLGAYSDVNDSLQAGTFMHELGHTLGLGHGGGDSINFKPNYYSVMNYAWTAPQKAAQYGGLGWTLNYSPVALPQLNESNLNDAVGLNPQPGDFDVVIVPYNDGFNRRRTGLLAPGIPIDWNGDGVTTGGTLSSADINWLKHNENSSPGEVLSGYADWPNLVYNFRNSSKFLDGSAAEYRTMSAGTSGDWEMTPEIYDSLQSLPPYGIKEPLSLWPVDPGENLPVSTAPSQQGNIVMIGDGRGGAIIAYATDTGLLLSNGDGMDVYVQHVDSLGGVKWRNNGIPICTAPGAQLPTGIALVGNGEAVIVWQDKRSGKYEVYAQKINEFGQTLWQDNGVPVTSSVNESRPPIPVVASDLQRGAIVAWRDAHTGTSTVYAQHLSQDGIIHWPGAASICTTPTTLRDTIVQITTDDSGGAIIAWVDRRAGAGFQNHDVYAQRVDRDGTVRWSPNGIPLCTDANEQDWPRIRRDGSGGAVVAWHDRRNALDDLYVQRVNKDGQVQWASGGVPISVGGGGKIYPEIATDGTGGAIIAWMDSRRLGSMYDVYAQRVNGSGAVMWQNDGVAICETTMCGLHPAIVTDQNGGAVIAYANQRDSQMDIYAQHVDSSGTTKWTKNGVPVSSAGRDQLYPVIVSNRAGGAIMTWYDHRMDIVYGAPHIYAQNITGTGGLGHDVITSVDERLPGALPAGFSLAQNYPNPFNPVTTILYGLPRTSHVTLKVYDVLGRVVTVLVDEIQGAGEKSVIWDARGMSSGVYFYRMHAISAADPTRSFTQVRKLLFLK